MAKNSCFPSSRSIDAKGTELRLHFCCGGYTDPSCTLHHYETRGRVSDFHDISHYAIDFHSGALHVR